MKLIGLYGLDEVYNTFIPLEIGNPELKIATCDVEAPGIYKKKIFCENFIF